MTALTCDDVRDLAASYVLGALERDEELEVTEHLRTCPDVHAEVRELAEMTPFLDQTLPQVEPPASLRGRILAAAAEDLAARRGPAAVATPTTIPTARRGSGQVISLDAARARRRDWRGWGAAVAAAIAIVALGAWNVVT